MIERPIPRDISKYEAKLMLGLTTRQVCLFAPGIACALIIFTSFKATLGDLALFLAILAACPFILFASFKPLGLPLEKFIKSAMLPMLLAPCNRKYKTENAYKKQFTAINSEASAPNSQNKKKHVHKKYISKNPDRQPI